MKRLFIATLLGLSFAVCQHANAVSYGFYKITSNNTTDISSQLSVEVTGSGANVSFKVINATGGLNSSIAEIYFDDGLFPAAPAIINGSTGVSFEQGANPANLPGQNNATPAFVTSQVFNSQADGNNATGINPGEWVSLTFGLGGFADLNAVFAAMESGDLRLGLHVRAIPNSSGGGSGSASYVSRGNGNNVPDGGSTLALIGLTVAGLGFLRRKLN